MHEETRGNQFSSKISCRFLSWNGYRFNHI